MGKRIRTISQPFYLVFYRQIPIVFIFFEMVALSPGVRPHSGDQTLNITSFFLDNIPLLMQPKIT